jgi:hypothetical protein
MQNIRISLLTIATNMAEITTLVRAGKIGYREGRLLANLAAVEIAALHFASQQPLSPSEKPIKGERIN